MLAPLARSQRMEGYMGTMKSLAVAQHMIEQCAASGDGSVTPMQLIKLVYIAHGYMLGLHGRPLLDESVQAWQYGPVVPSVYHAVKQFKNSPVTAMQCGSVAAFTDDERAVMRKVASTYGKFSGVILSSATHKPGTPWSVTWASAGQNAPISNDIIESFYADTLSKPSHSAL